MRKSLKPLKHRKSNIFALRRKLLKESESTLKDVSDFWKKSAENNLLINKENESVYKGSFDTEYEKKIDNANVSGIAESILNIGNETELDENNTDNPSIIDNNTSISEKITDDTSINNPSINNIGINDNKIVGKRFDKFVYQNKQTDNNKKKRKFVDFDTMIVKDKDDTLTQQNDINDKKLSSNISELDLSTSEKNNESSESDINTSETDSDMKNEQNNNKNNKTVENDDRNDFEGFYDKNISLQDDSNDKSEQENTVLQENTDSQENTESQGNTESQENSSISADNSIKNKSDIKENTHKSSQIILSLSSINDNLVHFKDEFHYVKNMTNLKQKNGTIYLINNKDLETGVMHLTSEAYTDSTQADRSLCILVLKGCLEVVVNDIKVVIKRNGMCVINKGDHWMLKNVANYISRIFLCYSLK